MNLSVCIDAIFNGKDFFESMKVIHGVGIKSFEFWSWWDKDIAKIAAQKNELGLEVSAFCTKFVSLVDEKQREAYLQGLQETLEVAKLLDCKRIITQVGNDLGIAREIQRRNLVSGLQACVPILEKADVTLVFEPLNTLVDHAGYYLSSSDEAFMIADAVGSSKVKVLFDIYHQQIMEGHLIQRIVNHIAHIGHFHAAGNPGRHELDKGEINYPEIFKAIDGSNYDGYIGLEYFPTEEPLKGIKALL